MGRKKRVEDAREEEEEGMGGEDEGVCDVREGGCEEERWVWDGGV